MLASRFCCAVTALLLGLSCLFGVTKHAVAQNAKGAGGQNCGCAKTSKGVGQTGAMPNQQYMLFNQVVAVPMASSAMPGQQHHKHHHHSTGQTMYPGQTTPWLMPSQPGYLVTNQQTAVTAQPGYNFAQPIQQPMIGQPLYNMGQPNQPGLYQQQLVQQQFVAIPIVPAAGQVPPAVNQPAYNFGQPNQPGYGLINQPVNQPGYGLINQPVNQPGYGLINQPVNQPGYAVPNQNVPSSFVYQPPQGTTPWLMQTSTQQNQATTGFGTNLSSRFQTGNCNKQQTVSQTSSASAMRTGGACPPQASTGQAHHHASQSSSASAMRTGGACPPQASAGQAHQHAAHGKKK